jgi:F420-dependent methylenetetrahydromethanopterin dehydrogenase
VVVVCGSAEADPGEVQAAVERARADGAPVVVVAAGGAPPTPAAADEVIADDVDVVAFGGRVLAALGVA